MKLLSTSAYLCISKRHCWFVVVEIRYTQQSTLCIFRLIFSTRSTNLNEYATYTLRNNLHFWQHYLVTVYMATIVVIQSLSLCAFFFSLSFSTSTSLISNLHLTPSWGKASHSSTVFVPVTSRAPPAYQYQLRQCWACNLQLNVILLNPIWKLNIEKPLAYLPVFLPLSRSLLYWPPFLQLSVLPRSLPSCSCFAHCDICIVLFVRVFVSHNGYLVELILILCHWKNNIGAICLPLVVICILPTESTAVIKGRLNYFSLCSVCRQRQSTHSVTYLKTETPTDTKVTEY